MASKQADFETKNKIFLGELALDGALRPIKGSLALAESAKKKGFAEIFLPKGNGAEASLIDGVKVFEATSLEEILNHLENKVLIKE